MKFKIEVELDWVEGDCSGYDGETNACSGPSPFNIDQAIFDKIATEISNKILKSNYADLERIESRVNEKHQKMEELIKGKIGDTVEKMIGDKINEIVEKWLFEGSGVTITDGYGDAKKTYANVFELVKEKFNDMLFEPVDNDGKPLSGKYGSTNQTRLIYTMKKLKESAEKNLKTFTLDEMKKVVNELEQLIQTHLSKQIGDKFLELSGIDLAKNKLISKG